MDAPAYDTYDQKLADFLMGPDGGLAHGVSAYLGMRMVRVEPGVAVVEVAVTPELVHGFGAVHGGVVATVVDQALGSAVLPLLPAGTWPATLEFKVNYLAAARQGVISATGTVVSLRKRTAVVQVEVTNEERTIAVALGTLSLQPPPSAA